IYAAFFAAWALIAGKLKPRGRWFLAGAALGLAYLAKGTAMLILFAFPVAWIAWGALEWRRRRREKRQPQKGEIAIEDKGPAAAPAVFRVSALSRLRSVLPFLAGLLLLGGPLF